jgi:MoaA/NifB/PqqE/SkfB family radical SAM enzyme
MISVSKLLCDLDAEGDGLRYDAAEESDADQIRERKQRRPVVVWNLTKQCNLYCEHCYAAATDERAPGELSTAEGKRLLDNLAGYGVPVVLFSGGEPLVREDLPELVGYAADRGIRPVLSTNGTLITPEKAAELRDAGLAYAGVSVDGLRERNDAFRGQEGAFDAAVRGIEACLDASLKTGLRYTITDRTAPDLEDVVDLLYDVGVDRFCFYHLDYGGRGAARPRYRVRRDHDRVSGGGRDRPTARRGPSTGADRGERPDRCRVRGHPLLTVRGLVNCPRSYCLEHWHGVDYFETMIEPDSSTTSSIFW